MRRRIAIILLAVLASLVFLPPEARADCHQETRVRFVYGHAVTYTVRVCEGTAEPPSTPPPGTQPVVTPTVGLGSCLAAAGLIGDNSAYCIADPDEPEPEVTPALVLAAFQRLPLPPSRLRVQPPNGRTLVNFDTNFFTRREPFGRHVTLLGRRVDLRIWPSAFTWRFGDGEAATTTTPGAPYPDLQVTHSYTATGPVRASVDTIYEAQWRVGGQPWRPVPGTVTIPGAAVGLDVVEARPTLVDYTE